MQQILARYCFDGFRRAAVRKSVGVPRSIKSRAEHAGRQSKWLVFFLHNPGQPLGANALDLRLRKIRMERNIAEQFQRVGKIP